MNDILAKVIRRLGFGGQTLSMFGGLATDIVSCDVSSIEKSRHLLTDTFMRKNFSVLRDNNMCTPSCDLQIVIPAYNVEKYIEQCVDSVLAQETQFSFKVFIVNDGSTDSTQQILEKYVDHPQVTIVNQTNKGLSEARNTGIKDIVGRYVMFVDSDDYLLSGAVESLMSVAVDTSDDLVQGAYNVFYDDTQSVDHTTRGVTSEVRRAVYQAGRLPGFAWGKVFKAELFKNIIFPPGMWYEDTIMGMCVFPLIKTYSSVTSPVYCYRKRRGSITASQATPRALETWWVTEGIAREWKDMGVEKKQSLYDFMFCQFRCNYDRVHLLNDKSVDIAMFILTCDLMKREFAGFCTEKKSEKLFEKSLRTYDFGLYDMCCKLM